MTVGELIKLLSAFPPEMPAAVSRMDFPHDVRRIEKPKPIAKRMMTIGISPCTLKLIGKMGLMLLTL